MDFIISTTSTLDGYRVVRYLGLVSGEAIMGANIIRDFMAGIRDVIGGRSAAYEESLREAKDLAIQEMVEQARSRGANAVIGVDLDYENIGSNGSMMMVTAAGTAVLVEPA